MIRLILMLFFLFGNFSLIAKCSEVSPRLKDKYASDMYDAFWLQSQGKSTLASFQFQSALEEAKKAGESVLRIIAIEQLFIWYRTYGSSLKLFFKEPTGTDKIHGQHRSSLSPSSNANVPFKSEWGNTPEQAAQVRDFMFGVGEVISGIFCATLSSGWGITISFGVIYNGCTRIYSALNNIWAGHEAMISLKQWEQGPLKTAEQQ
jgi:hypothetical protein